MPLKYLRNTAERLTGPIRASLSQPPKRLLQSSQGLSEFPGSARRASWIVGRRFLRHNLFEIAEALPEAKRKSALGLMVRILNGEKDGKAFERRYGEGGIE